MVQVAPYHINLNEGKTDFKDVYKIKKLLVIFKDTTMNQSVMPYDSSCYVNVARRLGHSGFIDALIQHGDNQVVKNLFMNSYKEG